MMTCCLSFLAEAQDYRTALGLRLGPSYGVTVKHFYKTDQAIEGILDARRGGFNLAVLWQQHGRAFDVQNLNWFIGGGAHVGTWRHQYGYPWRSRDLDRDGSYTVVGIDGIIGMEYTIPGAPINISLDWKPAINIVPQVGFWGDGFALSIRYAFK